MTRKTNLGLTIVAVLGVLGLCGPVWAFSGAGSGTEADPYVITDVYELQEMSDELTAYYVLGNDIDASATSGWNGGAGFVPIGTFTGIFDGRGHTITGFYINRPNTNGMALFGGTIGSEIKNLGMVDVDITGRMAVGALVNYNDDNSTIYNCWSSGNVKSTYAGANTSGIGGLVGSNADGSLISKCYSTANVTGNDAWQYGGLVGRNIRGSIIVDCYATGDVTGTHKVGGLVGDNMHGSQGGYVARCYSTGKVTGNGGGLIGYNWQGGVTYDSYWDIQTSGKTSSKGGTGKNTSQMMQQATFVGWDIFEVWDIFENETYPFLRPILKPVPVAVDIKPGSCPNPLNLKSQGVLPVAILGSQDFDVSMIDTFSIRLEDVAPIRGSYEDVAAPVANADECECTEDGPDGYLDLALKFRTQEIVEQLIMNRLGELAKGQTLALTLTGELFDGTGIEGTDCVKLVGNVSRWLTAVRWDANGDGIINMDDFALFAENWLQADSP